METGPGLGNGVYSARALTASTRDARYRRRKGPDRICASHSLKPSRGWVPCHHRAFEAPCQNAEHWLSSTAKAVAVELFDTLLEAQVLAERWRMHYNTVRPHSSLDYRPPAPEATQPCPPASPSGHG